MERAPVSRHGAARGQAARRADRRRRQEPAAADRQADAGDHPSRARRPRLRARARRGAPRSEARKCHGHPGARPARAREHQAARLRDREARTPSRAAGDTADHAARSGDRNARLHVSRAGGRSRGRHAQRCLLVRRDAVPHADRPQAVRSGVELRRPADAPGYAAQVSAGGRGRRLDSGRRGGRGDARPVEAARGALSIRGRASPGARARRRDRLRPHGAGGMAASPKRLSAGSRFLCLAIIAAAAATLVGDQLRARASARRNAVAAGARYPRRRSRATDRPRPRSRRESRPSGASATSGSRPARPRKRAAARTASRPARSAGVRLPRSG